MIKGTFKTLLVLSVLWCTATIASTRSSPNIVLIVADDLGFSDLQSYGSEIETPNLDRLASRGLRFSNYHTAPSCAPSRAMLMTGVDSHRAGVGNIAESIPPEQAADPHYQGSLNHHVVTVATLLKEAGYRTYFSGKWHLGYQQKAQRPINRGFDRTLMMPHSGADNWQQRPYLPVYERAHWYADGEEIQLPEDFYSSQYIVDKAMEFIDHQPDDERPFFSYISFQAVHIPVQAPAEFTNKYLDTYADGWTALREQRQQAVKALGMVPANAPMVTMPTTPDWEALSAEDQRYHAKSMAVYAGMVDAMDAHIGRFVNYLQTVGEYDNTVFIFTSDNGAEASDPAAVSALFPLWLSMEDYHTDYDRLGEKGSYNFIGPGFASAAAGPLGHYKFYSGEGGMRVPLIISGPAVVEPAKGKITPALAYVKDLAPTILQLANVEHPGTEYRGRTIEEITGSSLWPLLAGTADRVHSNDDVIAYEIGGNAALIKGPHKILFNRGPLGDDRWHLYNIATDPGEVHDLSQQQPELFEELLQDYRHYVQQNGVLAMPKDYDQRRQLLDNYVREKYVQPIVEFFAHILDWFLALLSHLWPWNP
ncbi:arylsulfatase [Aestuariirhabdus sp. Z084]|uniref:arylsulfatase n=1 Tax=Aestuariirhabdus haliotis TaxID=2918751 RepID=UPI00201B45A2|nr:arylsulfatase [Aestuariirhabdus haliotis]MCL6417589.1 arylsulfatase [Aestuariirhabdus haliotis]MCL6421507.1 arylsulfatase [Aestuariirhabdus haliotis]